VPPLVQRVSYQIDLSGEPPFPLPDHQVHHLYDVLAGMEQA
jgi:hypothetical protein